jgi:hypothetical protein
MAPPISLSLHASPSRFVPVIRDSRFVADRVPTHPNSSAAQPGPRPSPLPLPYGVPNANFLDCSSVAFRDG